MGDNPFIEPADADRTVIRPRPGGRRPAVPSPTSPSPSSPSTRSPSSAVPAPGTAAPVVVNPAQLAALEAAGAGDIAVLSAGGLSPLLAAAAPLLQLLARLRNTARPPDAGDLNARAAAELRSFEQRASQAGVPKEQLRTAHYALCASIDDVVLNTPWGAGGGWAHPLLALFHPTIAGDRFCDLLTKISRDPPRFLPLIELMYLCLSLGYQGPFRAAGSSAELEQLRETTHALIAAQQPAVPADLSPRWSGVAAPYQPARRSVPVWVVGAGALAVIAALFVWTATALNAASDVVFDKSLHAAPDHMPLLARAVAVAPPPPPPAEPGLLDKLRAGLKPDIDQGVVSVLGTDATPIVRVRNRGMFAAGGAVVQPALRPVLERVGTVLKDQPGPVSVIAYTDSQPIHTVQFPSNFQLSAARATAARAVAARTIGDAARLTAEGRADADPIAPNTTAENRELNRRIEFVLHPPQ